MPTNEASGSDRQKILMLATAGLAGAVLIGMMVFVGGPTADLGENAPADALSDKMVLGEQLYATTCAACHGDAGQGGVGPALDGTAGVQPFRPGHIEELVLRGGQRMPAVGAGWGETEVEAVAAYIERWSPDEEPGEPAADR